jgi:hypothetical protein
MKKILANEGFPVHTRVFVVHSIVRVGPITSQLSLCNLAPHLARQHASAAQMLDLGAKTFFD